MKRLIGLMALTLSLQSAQAETQKKGLSPCADPFEKAVVREYYNKIRPAAALSIVSRAYRMPESVIASALPPTWSVGTETTEDMVHKIWRSIDEWGDKTKVGLVFTSGGTHAFNFSGSVPMTGELEDDGFHDIYADGGDGVHGHIFTPAVKSVYAATLPTPVGTYTRMVGFYNEAGNLVIGVYASEGSGKGDAAAIEGFKKTRALIASMPRSCKKK